MRVRKIVVAAIIVAAHFAAAQKQEHNRQSLSLRRFLGWHSLSTGRRIKPFNTADPAQ